jgi:hypothetical protein
MRLSLHLGQDGERVLDLMDEEIIGATSLELDWPGVMTTWHSEESQEEALDFFLNCTVPDEAYAVAIRSRAHLEPRRRNNDLLSQPLHVGLHGLRVARDRTHHDLMYTSVTVTLHFI